MNMIPKLPTYSDQENSVYHPAFEYALQEALKIKQLSHIEIKKQYPSPTGPIDLVLFNTQSQKIILPIEIKRTQSNVRGGGRRQARDYWQNLGVQCESNFYCVSNLELTELFRYDESRPKTSAQQVKLLNHISGDLSDFPDPDIFYSQLITNLINVLEVILNQIDYIYTVGLHELQDNLESSIDNPQNWHKILIPACYEYIRGAAARVNNLSKYNWKPVSFFSKNPSRIISFGKNIDFEHIFKDPAPLPDDENIFIPSILLESYEAGKALGAGDDIAELINEILADYTPKKQGIVETDTELARLLSVIAKATLGRTLNKDETIIDPASGSGRLLTVLDQISFTNISPRQIKAIEKEPLFSEALSLRLGLAFSSCISPSNAPSVTIKGLEEVDASYFTDIKVVVMNPPYISGIQSKEIKQIFTERIHEVSGQKSILDIGQVALEVIFLELIYNLVPDGTIISAILPSNHLYRISQEMNEFRNYLLEKFGLKYIVTYPRRGLFSNVIKSTVILSGIKGQNMENINLVEIWDTVNNIQFEKLHDALLNPDSYKNQAYFDTGTINFKKIPTEELKLQNQYGWREFLGSGTKYKKFIDNNMLCFQTISSKYISRGSFGNNGNNELTVIPKNIQKRKYPSVISLIPDSWIIPLLNNTKNMPRVLTNITAPDTSFIPPNSAYIANTPDYILLNEIIDEYLKLYKHSSSAQTKKKPTKESIINSLKRNGRKKHCYSVLLPRGSRAKAEIGILKNNEMLISTNLLLIDMENIKNTELMGSWLLSIFGQLQLEYHSVSQEGMRKIEANNLLHTIRYPDFSKIDELKKDQLIKNLYSEKCIDFKNIKIREIDNLWAQILSTTSPDDLVNEALDIFQDLVDCRIGLG